MSFTLLSFVPRFFYFIFISIPTIANLQFSIFSFLLKTKKRASDTQIKINKNEQRNRRGKKTTNTHNDQRRRKHLSKSFILCFIFLIKFSIQKFFWLNRNRNGFDNTFMVFLQFFFFAGECARMGSCCAGKNQILFSFQ